MRCTYCSLFVLLLLLTIQSSAQYQAPPVWVFGHHAGLDFTSGSPVPITTNIETHSTVAATQCDAQGNILFYANGYRIWNKNNNPMPNSINPVWTTPYTSSWNLHAMIVPHPTDTNLYYVFSVFPSKGNAPWGDYFVGQLTYSIVDMSLNNGLGDVVAGQNHVLLDNNTGHYMTIVPGNHCNYWVIVQAGNTNQIIFKTYEVDGSGLHTTPVTSVFPAMQSLIPTPSPHTMSTRAGSYVYSYTRDKLIAGTESADIAAYDFDRNSGKITSATVLDWAYPKIPFVSSATQPAICLSPDESQLYVMGQANSTNGYELRQYPLVGSGATFATGTPIVISSIPQQYLIIEQSTGFAWMQGAMQFGPDGKIYLAYTLGQTFLGSIENPNVAGAGCNHVPMSVYLDPGTYTTSGMPAPMYTRRTPSYQVAGINVDTSACDIPALTLHVPDSSYTYYTWHNGGSGTTYDATASGTYIVTSSNGDCNLRNDTFNVKMVNYTVSLGADVQTCDTAYLYPSTNAPAPVSYTWQDGSTNPLYIASQPGTYSVTITADGCSKADTINLSEGELPVSLPADTTLCAGENLRLEAGNLPGITYRWQDGSTSPYYNASGAGLYAVTATNAMCSTSDSVLISIVDCSYCKASIPTAFTPNGDGRNDGFKPMFTSFCNPEKYEFRIYNRYGQQVFVSFSPTTAWDGRLNGQPAELGTYMYRLNYTLHSKRYSEKGDVVLVR